MTPIIKHTHKLKKHKFKSGNSTFFCALPDCQFKINPPLALGKKCVCWRCDKEFVLDEYAIRLVKPHCPDCHKSKNAQLVGSIPEEVFIDPNPSKWEGFPKPESLAERLANEIKQKQKEAEEEI